MRWKAAFALVGVFAGGFVVVANNGCSKDEESRRVSQKGEARQVTNDCAGGLACVPVPGGSGGGICVTGEFRISETARECAIVECQTANDCCNLSQSQQQQCPQLLALCTDAGLGSAACQRYDQYCKCNTDRVACESSPARARP
jgi:hypothetical protein